MAKKKSTKKKSTKSNRKPKRVAAPVNHSAVRPSDPVAINSANNRPVKLSNSFRLFVKSLAVLFKHKRLFGGITLVYGLLTILLVRGLSGGGLDISQLKTDLNELFGTTGGWSMGTDIFKYMLGNNNQTGSEVAGTYQVLLFIIVSLSVIWALRQVHAGETIKVKDAFYKSMYPFVQFIIVLIVFAIQMFPFLLGTAIYGSVTTNGLAVTAVENVLWAAVFFLLVVFSLYLVSSSLFALYIVTLPDMTPRKALRSARKLVKRRRWKIIRKVLFLPVALLVIAAIVTIPIIVFIAPIADWVFFALTMLSLPVIHSYYYTLYRELL